MRFGRHPSRSRIGHNGHMARPDALHSTSGTAVVWVEASLTNHGELVAELGLPPDADDAVVVRAAHRAWGEATAHHLRGPFAFATRTEQTGEATVIRDHLGVMPAYWAFDAHGHLHLGDTLQSVADQAHLDVTPDAEYTQAVEVKSAGLLATRTPAEQIACVPPGSRVLLRGGDVRVEPWWTPADGPRITNIAVDVAATQLRTLLRAAVDDVVATCLRLGYGHPSPPASDVAAHLSGGMDSAVVAFLGQAALARRDRTLACALSWSPEPELSIPRTSRTTSPSMSAP